MTNEIPNIVRYAPKFTKVEMKHLDLYFSYETLVAFCHDHPNLGPVWAVRQNDWGPTTGGHLNSIDGGVADSVARRVDKIEFDKRLKELNL